MEVNLNKLLPWVNILPSVAFIIGKYGHVYEPVRPPVRPPSLHTGRQFELRFRARNQWIPAEMTSFSGCISALINPPCRLHHARTC